MFVPGVDTYRFHEPAVNRLHERAVNRVQSRVDQLAMFVSHCKPRIGSGAKFGDFVLRNIPPGGNIMPSPGHKCFFFKYLTLTLCGTHCEGLLVEIDHIRTLPESSLYRGLFQTSIYHGPEEVYVMTIPTYTHYRLRYILYHTCPPHTTYYIPVIV